MKVKAPSLVKKIIEALSSKTNELRIRMMIFFLLHKNLDKSSLTNSLHALVSHPHHHHKKRKKNDDVLQDEQQQQQQESQGHSLMMNYNKATSMHDMVNNTIHDDDMSNNVVDDNNVSREHQVYNHDDVDVHDDDEKHPRVDWVDLSDLSFQESKVEMEDREDIDQAADLFIQRFRKQMILQNQRSLERQNWLLLSNA